MAPTMHYTLEENVILAISTNLYKT